MGICGSAPKVETDDNAFHVNRASTQTDDKMGNCCTEPNMETDDNAAHPEDEGRELDDEEDKNAFFVIGAPTAQTFLDIKTAFDRHGKTLTIFFEADLKTYMKQAAKDSPNVYSIPTNLRAPYQYRPGISYVLSPPF